MTTSPANDNAIDRLLFAPESSWPLAIMRIMLGTVTLAWAVSLMFEASTFLSQDGLLASEFGASRWRPFELAGGTSVWLALAGLAVAAVFVIVGFRPSLFLVIAFVLMVSLQRRNPVILNSGDLILRNLVFLLALTPSGAALSIDRWRKYGRDALWSAPRIAPWGMRLIQLQMMLVYFIAFWSKSGGLWTGGTAVSTALRLTELQRFVLPDAVITSVPLIALFTWGTLAIELALAVLLWNKRLRPALILLGLSLHLPIDALMLVGFFSLTMISGLMSFLDGDAVDRQVTKLRRRGSAAEATAPVEAPAEDQAGAVAADGAPTVAAAVAQAESAEPEPEREPAPAH